MFIVVIGLVAIGFVALLVVVDQMVHFLSGDDDESS